MVEHNFRIFKGVGFGMMKNKKSLTSILKSYPIGAVMLLETGGSGINFKPSSRGLILDNEVTPKAVLDGQQYYIIISALYLEGPVKTRDDRGRDIKRRYYLDINIATDEYGDKDEAIVSTAEDGIIKGKGMLFYTIILLKKRM